MSDEKIIFHINRIGVAINTDNITMASDMVDILIKDIEKDWFYRFKTRIKKLFTLK